MRNSLYLFSDPPLSIASPTPSPHSIPGTLSQLSPLATATVSPNESWYRPNPNTYQNTTVITINKSRTNITLKFPNGSIMVSNATQTKLTATSDYNQSYVVFNNTLPEYANRIISFKVNGVEYANKDTNPPASIGSLQNTTYVQSYISWSWTDPEDADFSKVMIYLNGTFQTNVTKGIQAEM